MNNKEPNSKVKKVSTDQVFHEELLRLQNLVKRTGLAIFSGGLLLFCLSFLIRVFDIQNPFVDALWLRSISFQFLGFVFSLVGLTYFFWCGNLHPKVAVKLNKK
ncbi:MAG: hypothetical protein DRO11_00775 [Methanobacteriota archaeon]|nr:MAG: hypothetical protein DRO11_00775 [Euryarchaeota archaeon]